MPARSGLHGEWRSDGGLTIVWRPASRDVTVFPAERPPELAHAGAVAEAPTVDGAELIWRRVAVFWPGEDKNFAGRVTAWGDGEHTVAYDDGEELTETLSCSCIMSAVMFMIMSAYHVRCRVHVPH